ncbi:hypothetical protein K525DRAFT_270697 [Schizophyllum commune Loenen D]|nr:hypothetical protein K525DRAFT_270697 [Schizophyllum commune Loenen D]
MAGPNLEVFKFSMYLFIPIFALVHFGDPEWYHNHVLPYRAKLFPPEEKTNILFPKDQTGIREELERLKAERKAKTDSRRDQTQDA